MTLQRHVIEILDQVEVLSLDVFDTSIHRAVLDPADLYALVPERVPQVRTALRGGARAAGARYRALRRSAESRARRLTASREVGLAEIFAVVAERVGDEPLADALRSAELELELELVRPSEPGLELAAAALERGRRLVYLSDMYLPSSFISTLLARAGLPDAPVLVSNEHGITKASGELFTKAITAMGAAAPMWLHVGDDPHSDHFGAVRAGVRSLLVEKPSRSYRRRGERFRVPRDLTADDSLALGLAAPGASRVTPPLRARNAATRLEEIGEVALGPAVLAFTSWIADRAGAGAAPLLFCSRDGALPLEAYRKLAPRWGATATAQYFHVSRRSVGVPALAGGLRESHRELLCGGRRPRSTAQLFARVGLDRSVAEGGVRLVEGAAPIDDPLPPGAARHLVFDLFKAVEDQVVERAQAELAEVGKYWASCGLSGSPEVVLVDVGWRATVQRALQDCLALLGEPTRCRGLYLSLLDHGPLGPGSADGMLVRHGRPLHRRAAVEAGVPVVELMFQADHGSVVAYMDGEPVLDAAPGSRDVADPVQRGARRYLDSVTALDRSLRPSPLAVRPLLRLLNQPRPDEARDLGRFAHSDGLADDANAEPILPAATTARQLAPFAAAGRTRLRGNEWRPGLVATATASTPLRFAASHVLGALKTAGALALRLRNRPAPPR